jgi:hypothetical protein
MKRNNASTSLIMVWVGALPVKKSFSKEKTAASGKLIVVGVAAGCAPL